MNNLINTDFVHSIEFSITALLMTLIFFFTIYTLFRKEHTPFKDDYLSGVIYIIIISYLFASIVGIFVPRILLVKNADELLKSNDFIKCVISFYFVVLMICYIKLYEASFMKESYDYIRKENVRPRFDNLDFMFGLVFTMMFSLVLSAGTFLVLEHSKPFIDKVIQKGLAKEKQTVVQKNDIHKTNIVIQNNKQSFALYFDSHMLKIETPKNWHIKNENAIIRFSVTNLNDAVFLTFNNISDKDTCLNIIQETSRLNGVVFWLQGEHTCNTNDNNFISIIPIKGK